MDVETTDRLSAPPCPPPRRIPSADCLGFLAGLAAACVATEVLFKGDGGAGALFLCSQAPFLAVAGACLGAASRAHGWARVRPVVWAALLAVVLDLYRPTGWVLGGAAGGAFTGLLRRSRAGTWRGALLGAGLGLAGWGWSGSIYSACAVSRGYSPTDTRRRGPVAGRLLMRGQGT